MKGTIPACLLAILFLAPAMAARRRSQQLLPLNVRRPGQRSPKEQADEGLR